MRHILHPIFCNSVAMADAISPSQLFKNQVGICIYTALHTAQQVHTPCDFFLFFAHQLHEKVEILEVYESR